MFASASRRRRRLSGWWHSRSGVITRIRTGTGAFLLERREGGHVCEAVQCRSLGLSLSNSRGLECAHTFDRSHRRACRHQDYKRIIIMQYYVSRFWGCYYILHTRSFDYGTRAIGGRFLTRTPYVHTVQYYTSWPHGLMYCGLRSCHVVLPSPNQSCNAYSSSPRSIDAPGLHHEILSILYISVPSHQDISKNWLQ